MSRRRQLRSPLLRPRFKLAKPPSTLHPGVAVAGVPGPAACPPFPTGMRRSPRRITGPEQADAGPSFAEQGPRALEDREGRPQRRMEGDATQSYAAQDEARPPPPRPRYYPVRAQRYARSLRLCLCAALLWAAARAGRMIIRELPRPRPPPPPRPIGTSAAIRTGKGFPGEHPSLQLTWSSTTANSSSPWDKSG